MLSDVLSALLVVPPLLLIATLVVSAVAKLLDPRDTTSVFIQLRLRPLIRLGIPRLLPYGELALAGLLLLAPGRWYVVATSAALLLFLAYFLVILRALRLPYPVTCPCFGRLGLGDVTARTLSRNAVLLVLAVLTWVASWARDAGASGGVVQQWVSLGGALAWVTGIIVVTAALAFVVTLAVVVRRRSTPPLTAEDPDGYRPSPAPDGILHGPDGPMALHALTDEAARLLVFCDPERDVALMSRATGWGDLLSPVRVHVVIEGPVGTADVLRDPDGVLRTRLGVGTPAAVLLGTDRMLAGGPVTGEAEIDDLVGAIAEELGLAPPV